MQTTELDAINVIIQSIGEPPINTLEGGLPSDAALASTILSEVSREFQSTGWYWNTDRGYTFVRDGSNQITVPSNVLHIDFYVTGLNEPVQRGTRLYDRQEHSYAFTRDLKADRVINFLPFEEMPEAARRYVSIRAARIFQTRYLGSGQLEQAAQESEARAYAVVQQDELRAEKPNMLGSPTARSILHR